MEVYQETVPRDALYEPYLTEQIVPSSWPDLENAEELSELQTAIKDYVSQCQAK